MKLTVKEASEFYSLFFSLLDFANKKYEINESIDIEYCVNNDIGLHPIFTKEIADYIWNHTNIINEFIDYYHVEKEDKELLLSWKKCLKRKFLVERHLKKGSIFIDIDTQKVYLVQGLYSSWDEMVPYTPIMIEATLLPFKDKIISDGIINIHRVRFGAGTKSMFKQTYMNAKNNNLIIKEL